MNKSLIVHYKNKYPGGFVQASENALDVFDKSGAHVVALRKNGAGQWVCVSEEMGSVDKHDLAPIPREARIFKVNDGKIGQDEEAPARAVKHKEFLCAQGRKVLSCDDLKKQGYDFDDKGRVTARPEKKLGPPPQA